MSDSSDADSSDDDLLASPVFKKRDRRTERAERNKLDFLESCLRGSDARTDVHRRIASVECEFKKDRGGGGAGEEGGGGPASSPEEGRAAGDGGGGKENDPNRTDSAAAAGKAGPPAASGAAESEAAYWRKIESYAERNAQRTPGAAAVHSARRTLADAVSGLDYASDLTDDEGGKWKDGVSGMTREQMRNEAEAKSQGLSSDLGLRRMFRPGAAAGKGASTGEGGRRAFDSRKEAMDELKAIASSLQRSHRAPNTPAHKTLRARFVDPLVKIVKKPHDSIWDYLGYFLRRNPVVCGKYTVILPGPFCEWMWKLACSPFRVGQQCSIDCFHLLRKFVAEELDVRKDPPSFGADMAFLEKFCTDDLVACLENQFGLWLGHGPMPLTVDGNDEDNNGDAMEISKERGLMAVDMHALKNTFLLWTALFRRNLIRIRCTDEDSSALGADASKALVAFTRVGLDPQFYSAKRCDNTGGEHLHGMVQKSMLALVRTATSQIHKQFDQSRVEQWLKQTASLLVDACSDLSAGYEGAADSDDAHGDLPLAMAVKRMWSCEMDCNFSFDVALMKLDFAEQALRKCLDEIPDWENKVKERTEFLCKDWDRKDVIEGLTKYRLEHAMHALVAAEVGFQWIDEESESFMDDHPHLLAAVSIAGECALVGACMYWFAQRDGQPEEPVYSAEEMDSVHESVSNIEDLCDSIRKECRVVIAYPHLRRTKEYLTRLSKSLGGTKGKSSRDKRQKRREQGSLDSYFSRPSMSDPYRDTQDS